MPLIDSVDLALDVRERNSGAPGREHVLLVHGYPDQQDMWDPVAELLAGDSPDAMHVVTYDVRGAGGSGVPSSRDGYRIELLVEDLVAVVAATVPEGESFHLVGHDWGSVQLWDVVAAERTDARLHGRIASFTSVSGPSLDHTAYLFRHSRGRRLRLLRQAARSWYVYAFHVPRVPELVWTTAHRRIARVMGGPGGGHWGPELGANAARGVGLYRANAVGRMGRRPKRLETDVPVLVVVPRRDPFLTTVLLEDLDEECHDLRIEYVDAGHWVPRTHPEELARLVTEHVRSHAAAGPG